MNTLLLQFLSFILLLSALFRGWKKKGIKLWKKSYSFSILWDTLYLKSQTLHLLSKFSTLTVFHHDLSIQIDTKHGYFQFPIHGPSTQAAALWPRHFSLSARAAEASQIVTTTESRRIGSTQGLERFGNKKWTGNLKLLKILITIPRKKGSCKIRSHLFIDFIHYIILV